MWESKWQLNTHHNHNKWNSNDVIFLLQYVPLSTKCQRIDALSWWNRHIGRLIAMTYSFLFSHSTMTRFCILTSRITIYMVSSRHNLTVKGVHSVGAVIQLKRLVLIKVCSVRFLKAIIFEFHNSNAKQKLVRKVC